MLLKAPHPLPPPPHPHMAEDGGTLFLKPDRSIGQSKSSNLLYASLAVLLPEVEDAPHNLFHQLEGKIDLGHHEGC